MGRGKSSRWKPSWAIVGMTAVHSSLKMSVVRGMARDHRGITAFLMQVYLESAVSIRSRKRRYVGSCWYKRRMKRSACFSLMGEVGDGQGRGAGSVEPERPSIRQNPFVAVQVAQQATWYRLRTALEVACCRCSRQSWRSQALGQ